MNDPLHALGERVAAASDRQANAARTLAVARSRLFDAASHGKPRGARGSLRFALAALACTSVAALSLYLLRPWRPVPMTYVVQSGQSATQRPFVETKNESSKLQFNEGSVVAVMPESGLRVLDLTPKGVTLSVERGQARFEVVHRPDTAWVVRAGPFDVRVTGTRFTTAWHPADGRFELGLDEGSVEVTGPQLSGAQRLVAGEHLVVELRQGTKSLTQGQAAPSAAIVTATPAPETPTGSATTSRTDVPTSASLNSAPGRDQDGPRWEDLARSGRYRDAMAMVEGLGFDSLLHKSDAARVRLLADTARMAGSGVQARRALLALRRQHGVKAETAFLLGKVAADQLRSPGEALTWFDTYLREEPGGSLREQAMGRSLELDASNVGESSLARARRYLAAYPKGAHAPLARKLLEKSNAER